MLPLAALEPPPIFHPMHAGAFFGALVLGMVALRAPIALSRGPSAAWTPAPAPRWRSLVTLLALGGLAFVGYAGVFGFDSWPPISSERRVGWALAGLTVVGAVLAIVGVPSRLNDADGATARSRLPAWAWLAGAALVLGTLGAAAAVWPNLLRPDARLPGVISVLVAGGGAVLMALPLGAMERRGSPFAAAFVLAGVILAGAGALIGSGSIALGQITLSAGFSALALALVAGIKRGAAIGGLTIALAAGLLAMLLLAGHTWSFLPLHAPIVLALSPLAALLTHMALPRSVGPKLRAALCILASAIVAGAALGSAISLEGRAGLDDEYQY